MVVDAKVVIASVVATNVATGIWLTLVSAAGDTLDGNKPLAGRPPAVGVRRQAEAGGGTFQDIQRRNAVAAGPVIALGPVKPKENIMERIDLIYQPSCPMCNHLSGLESDPNLPTVVVAVSGLDYVVPVSPARDGPDEIQAKPGTEWEGSTDRNVRLNG